MVLTGLQRSVLRSIAKNRSDTSYIAGGVALNMDWPRLSDDIDIFHDTDEEIGIAAERDIQTLPITSAGRFRPLSPVGIHKIVCRLKA
jgi:hypothetical protein